MNSGIWIFLAALGIGVVLFLTLRKRDENKETNQTLNQTNDDEQLIQERLELESQYNALSTELDEMIKEAVNKHAKVLLRKHRQHLQIDEYGVTTGYNEMGKELDYFMSNVVQPNQSWRATFEKLVSIGQDLSLFGKNKDDYHLDKLEIKIREHINETKFDYLCLLDAMLARDCELDDSDDVDDISGMDFEIHCQNKLSQVGWKVIRKGGASDQGVDLIAEHNGVLVAIQCKRSSKPVGNKAVQEVEAGRQYEKADIGIVVSNASFTPSARQLASSLGIFLQHHTELKDLKDLLSL